MGNILYNSYKARGRDTYFHITQENWESLIQMYCKKPSG